MRRLIPILMLTLAATACRSQTRSNPAPQDRAANASSDFATCEAPELTERLAHLHDLAVADRATPSRVRAQLHEALDGLTPLSGNGAALSLSVPPSPAKMVPVLHHAPQFQGEDTPATLHWDREAVGKPAGGIRYALNRKVDEYRATEVNLALWSNTKASDVARVFAALRKAGVERVNLIGKQSLPDITTIDAPGAAAKRFSELRASDDAGEIARAQATLELERIVFDVANHHADFSTRVMDPQDDFEERSAAYIDFLQREQARSGCAVPEDNLVWLYRARFLPEAPIAVLPARISDSGLAFDFDRDTTWALIAEAYQQLVANPSDERLAISHR